MPDGDLDLMESLLGDPAVKTHLDHPKSQSSASALTAMADRFHRRGYYTYAS
jgi:hypothetical protein